MGWTVVSQDYGWLKPFKGAYVKLTVREYRHKSGAVVQLQAKPEGDVVDVERYGILGFKRGGRPTLNGEVVYCFGRTEILEVTELWKPAKDAIRFICFDCREHPLYKLVEEQESWHSQSCSKFIKCSLCGHGAYGMSFLKVPHRFWKYGKSTPHSEIEDELIDLKFRRLLYENNCKLTLYQVKRNSIRPRLGSFELYWEGGFRSYHHEPPLSAWWLREVEMQELIECAERVDGAKGTIFTREKTG